MATTSLILGTRNAHKVEELVRMLPGFPLPIRSLRDFQRAPEVVEDAPTFRGNAEKKALTLAAALGQPVLADDSGLEVDALDGRPGVRSHRYAGPRATDAENTRKVLDEMVSVPEPLRQARFRCALALALPDRIVATVEGVVEGLLLREPRGTGGFGYDPIFLFPPLDRTFAQLSPEEKNRVSHRARALDEIRPHLLAFASLLNPVPVRA